MLPLEYAAAARFIPWIAIGVGLFGLYLVPMNAVSMIAGRTRWVWVFTLLAASINIGLNVVLIPRIGALAAAINTMVAYAVLLVGVSVYMRRVVKDPIDFDWRRIGLGLLVLVLGMASAMMLTPPEPVVAIVLRSLVMVAAVALLVVTGLWPVPLGRLGRSLVTRRND